MAERLDKRILKSNAARAIAAAFIAFYIWLVRRTSRFTVEGRAEAEALWNSREPFVAAFWHQRLLMMPYAWESDSPFGMLISQNRDGDMIARAIGHFGYGAVRGSTKNTGKDKAKGGLAAVRTIVKALRQGQSIGFTPDGPRGPALQASEGVIAVARLSGAPVFPVTYAVSRKRTLNTWDRFVLALPFSRGVFMWGAPIHVPRDADATVMEQKRLALEMEISRLTQLAEQRVGNT